MCADRQLALVCERSHFHDHSCKHANCRPLPASEFAVLLQQLPVQFEPPDAYFFHSTYRKSTRAVYAAVYDSFRIREDRDIIIRY